MNRPKVDPGREMIPFLYWSPTSHGHDGYPLACPQCGGDYLHFTTNVDTGKLLSIGYWCEFQGCQGRIEFEEYKGQLIASLHSDPKPDPS